MSGTVAVTNLTPAVASVDVEQVPLDPIEAWVPGGTLVPVDVGRDGGAPPTFRRSTRVDVDFEPPPSPPVVGIYEVALSDETTGFNLQMLLFFNAAIVIHGGHVVWAALPTDGPVDATTP